VGDIIKSVFRYKWMILAIFILVAAPAIAVIWTQIVPKYQARAELRIRPIIPRLVFNTDENGMIPLYDSFVNTQVSVMRSASVLQRVLDEKKVQETQWYKNPPESLKQRLSGNQIPNIERLRAALSVRPRFRTEIVDVSFVDPSAKDARLIVDTILEQYLQYVGQMTNEDEQKVYLALVEQHDFLEKDILGREQTIAELVKSLKTQNPQSLVSIQRIRLDDTKARLSALRQNIALLESAIKDGNDPAVILAATQVTQPKYYVDPVWRGLEFNVKNLRHQIATSGMTPKHPNMLQMLKDLEFAEEMLQQQEARLDEQWGNQLGNSPQAQAPITVTQWRNQPINVLGATVLNTNTGSLHTGQGYVPVTPLGNQSTNVLGAPIATTNTGALGLGQGLGSLEQQLTQARNQEKLLNEELINQEREFNELFDTAQLLTEETNALNHKRTLFDAVRQRMDAKDMERNIRDVIANIEVLTWAFAPSQPYSDRRMVFTAMTLVMGLGLGGGMAFLRAMKNQTIYSLRDMPYPMQVPFLGHVPEAYSGKSHRGSMKKLLYGDKGRGSTSDLVESIRLVRTALLSRLNHQASAAVLITSAVPGTGKSHFTVTLGESLARAGKKVLLIDADLRKRTLTRQFNLSGKSGFLDSLHARSTNTRYIFPTDTFGLSVMPAGEKSDNDSVFEETANGAFKACMAQLREQYDIILLDCSPILPVADATILSSQVDGTVMVERQLVSRQGSQIEALTRLISSGGHLLGTVFVRSEDRKDYSYKYAYGSA